jgi:hypothetical protein
VQKGRGKRRNHAGFYPDPLHLYCTMPVLRNTNSLAASAGEALFKTRQSKAGGSRTYLWTTRCRYCTVSVSVIGGGGFCTPFAVPLIVTVYLPAGVDGCVVVVVV